MDSSDDKSLKRAICSSPLTIQRTGKNTRTFPQDGASLGNSGRSWNAFYEERKTVEALNNEGWLNEI